MDILDILLDILLKPPQPFIGLFFLTTPFSCGIHFNGIRPFKSTQTRLFYLKHNFMK